MSIVVIFAGNSTGIACLAQNLEYETDADEIRNTAAEILTQTDRVTRIVESLINFSHVGAHGRDVKLTPSNLADCVDEAIHLLQMNYDAKPVSFENETDRELVVLADSQRLLQVCINLLGNARDACEPGGSRASDPTRSDRGGAGGRGARNRARTPAWRSH